MAKIFDNGIIVATGFRLDDPRPLDDKDIVATFNDLLTLENAYEGITVKVQDEDYEAYTWFQGAQNVAGNWKVSMGGGSDGDAVHTNVGDEFQRAGQQAGPMEALGRILVESGGGFAKSYITGGQLNIFQGCINSNVTSNA